MKKTTLYSVITFVLMFPNFFSFGQQREIDSLKNILSKATESQKIEINYGLGNLYQYSEKDSAVFYYSSGLKLASKINNEKLMAVGYCNLGQFHFQSGKYNEAITQLFKALKIFESKHLNNKVIFCLQYIALAYNEQRIYDKAMQYSLASLKLAQTINDKYAIGAGNGLIGSIYYTQQNTDSAIPYFLKGLELMEEIKDDVGISDALNNLALIYTKKKNYDKALEYHIRGLKLAADRNNKMSIATSYLNIAGVYKDNKDYAAAIKYLEKCIMASKEIGALLQIKESHKGLTEIYEKLKKTDLAYENIKLFLLYQDTLLNEESKKQFAEMNAKYETEKKEGQILLMQKEKEQEALVTLERHRKQLIIIWSIIGGMVLVLIFTSFVFRSLRITRKQKNIIELQKTEVERQKKIVDEHQKDIIDSIRYAKRIQTSLLPTDKFIERILQPKDKI